MQDTVTKYEQVTSVLRKPPDSRNEFEVNALVPWFRKRSTLFESLKTDIVFDVIKNLSFLACDADEVLIKEGDLGDCMYIILRGTVGIYRLSEDPKSGNGGSGGTEEQQPTGGAPSDSGASKGELIRQQLGERVTTIGENCSFGDVALMSDDCIRTASVLTEEPSDLIVFDKDLYNRSVKSVLKKEFDDKTNFIANSRYFRYWQSKYRKQLAMAMTKMTMPYEATLTRQGETVHAIYFLLTGEVKVVMDPQMHRIQYRKMMSRLDETRDLRQKNDSQNEDDQKKTKILRGQDKKPLTRMKPSEKSKRSNGQTGIQLRRSQSTVELCLLGVNECIGDIEVMMELRTYLQTAICTQKTEVLQVELKHFERLFIRRHPRTVDMMKEDLTVRLGCRMSSSRLTSAVSILVCLIEMAERNVQLKRRQTAARRAAVPLEPNQARRNRTISEFYEKFVPLQGALIDLYGPGTVFHRIRKREQVRVARLEAAGGHRLRRVLKSGANTTRTKNRVRKDYSWKTKFEVDRMPSIVEAKHARLEFGEESKNDGGSGDARKSDETIDPVLKNLEDRMHNWLKHRADIPDFRRQRPGVSTFYKTQTEVQFSSPPIR